VIRRIKFLLLPVLVLVFLTIYTAYSLFGPDETAERRALIQRTHEELQRVDGAQRRIAAAALDPKIVEVPCEQVRASPVVTKQKNVFIKLVGCGDDKALIPVALQGDAGQSLGKFFQSQPSEWLSEFLALREGANSFQVHYSLNGKHKKTQIIKIEMIATEIQ
jgi:hypothetical protein